MQGAPHPRRGPSHNGLTPAWPRPLRVGPGKDTSLSRFPRPRECGLSWEKGLLRRGNEVQDLNVRSPRLSGGTLRSLASVLIRVRPKAQTDREGEAEAQAGAGAGRLRKLEEASLHTLTLDSGLRGWEIRRFCWFRAQACGHLLGHRTLTEVGMLWREAMLPGGGPPKPRSHTSPWWHPGFSIGDRCPDVPSDPGGKG